MPGQYAHMAVINEFTLPELEKLGLPRKAISALLEYRRYAAFGSISPDFPFYDPFQKFWIISVSGRSSRGRSPTRCTTPAARSTFT